MPHPAYLLKESFLVHTTAVLSYTVHYLFKKLVSQSVLIYTCLSTIPKPMYSLIPGLILCLKPITFKFFFCNTIMGLAHASNERNMWELRLCMEKSIVVL